MRRIDWEGKKVKIMEEIDDPEYGKVLVAYVNHVKSYFINGSIVTDEKIFFDLENKYGIPLSERDIEF